SSYRSKSIHALNNSLPTWIALLLLYLPGKISAQEFQWPELNEDLQFKPIVAIQLWGTYTYNCCSLAFVLYSDLC
ncbi:MAG: hypothetical protein AAF242_06730, partial [Bacteroidota bacterium]